MAGRENLSQSDEQSDRQHAIVIGGSLAGLLAARVLADHFGRVTLLERDTIPVGIGPRSGLPQARHIHILLDAGRRALNRLLPRLVPQLVDAGAEDYDSIADFEWISPAGLRPRFPSQIRMLGATRDLIDWQVRKQLAAYRQIEMRSDTRVTGLCIDRNSGRVAGVTAAKVESDSAEEIAADLVIDATGRGSRAPDWLEAIGYPRPDEIVINGFTGYASRIVRPPSNWQTDWKAFYIQCAPPDRRRGGIIASVERSNWIVTLIGGGKDYPPATESGFRAFAQTLPDQRFVAAYTAAEPLTPIVTTRSTENRLRRYENLDLRPGGFLVIGDAVCAFNPVYGQGMSAAAVGAVTLDECLRKASRVTTSRLAYRFQHRLAKANVRPWLLATGEDYRYSEVAGPPPSLVTRATHGYLDRISALATQTPSVHLKMAQVLHLTHSPGILFAPWLVARALLTRHRG